MPTALVTGASRGIGLAVARALAQTGWSVALGCRENIELTRQAAVALRAHTPCIAVQADVSDPKAVCEMVQTVHSQLGKIDLLVNNAGVAYVGLLQDMTAQQWSHVMGVNLDGAFYLTRAVLPDMLNRHSGCIVNIASMWGQVGASCEAAYSAAKAGLIGLTKALAQELGPAGVRVNCVSPGVIDTDMNRHLSAQDIASLCEQTPLGRIGTPWEVAQAVLFLASPAAAFITGQVLGVNGGIVV